MPRATRRCRRPTDSTCVLPAPISTAANCRLQSDWEVDFRAERLDRTMPDFIERFDDIWAATADQLLTGARYFETYDTTGKSPAELVRFMEDGRIYMQWAWEQHFEIMYLLLVNQAGFHELCDELRIARADAGRFFQGYESKISEGDQALWRITEAARESGLAERFAAANAPDARFLAELAGGAGRARAGLGPSLPSCRNGAGAPRPCAIRSARHG